MILAPESEAFIACADLHITSARPLNRIDKYFETALWKFEQIIDLCNEKNASLIMAGDIFDSSKVGIAVVNAVIRILNKLERSAYVVAGQHDMVNHKNKDLSGSPLQTLVEKDKVIFLGSTPLNKMYGVSFGQDVPNVKYRNGNILVIHKAITQNDPPFWLKEAISSEQALNEFSGFQLIISGDYHYPFVVKKGNRILINCGPMLRNKIDYVDHAPRVYFVDIKNKVLKAIKLEFKPSDEVFRIQENKKDGKYAKELFERVAHSLQKSVKTPGFKKITYSILAEVNDTQVTRKAKDIMGRVYDEYKSG